MNILAAFLSASQSGNASAPAANAGAGQVLVFADVMQQVSAGPWGQPIGHGTTGAARVSATPILQKIGPAGPQDDELSEEPPGQGGQPVGENVDGEGIAIAAAQVLAHFPKEDLPGSTSQSSATGPAAPPPFMHVLPSPEADDVPTAGGGEVPTEVMPPSGNESCR